MIFKKLFNRYLPLTLSVLLLVGAGLVYLFLNNNAKPADAAWYNASWGYRKAITIDHNKVSGVASSTLNSFPILINVTDSDLKYTGSGGKVGRTDGLDMVFTQSDGTTTLSYEMEKYASTTGETIAWVKIPILSAVTDTTIYLYFGNSGASDQSSATSVWDSNYKSVWHMADNSANTTVAESTSNANTGTSAANTSTKTVSGQTGRGLNFNGTSDYVSVGSISGAAGTYTFSFWLNKSNSLGYFFDSQTGRLVVDMGDNAPTAGALSFYDNSSWKSLGSSQSNNTWLYAVLVLNSSNSTASGYINGSLVGTSAYNTVSSLNSSNAIGSYNTGGLSNFITASLDEYRISNTVRSADWIATEYNNQVSPSSFYAYGALSIQNSSPSNNSAGSGAAWYNASWSYRKPITIDHNKVGGTSSSTLNSFPLLVSVTDSDLKYTGSGGKMASSTAGDLLFTGGDGTTKLDFELEKYSSTTGETIAWVRIPILHATYDDTIYVYFGNNSATNQQNATGVWDSSFKGVWHLGNGTTLGLNDSTSNAYNLTNDSVAATTTKISGGGAWNGNNILQRTTNSNLASPVFTYSYWVKINTTGSHMTMIEPMTGGASHLLQVRLSWDGVNQQMSIQDEGVQQVGKQTTGLLANTIYHLAVSYDASGNYKFYLNGALDGSGTNLVDFSGGTGNFNVGARILKTIENLDGWMDEIKVSNAVRNADWIKTEYNNQSSPSTFYSYGALQTPTKTTRSGFGSQGASTLGWYSASWSYRKPITIDHNKVGGTSSSTLNSFPLLVSVTDSDLKYTGSGGKMASSTAGDLLFTASDGTTKLDFELESYSSSTGATVAWVRIPILHATSDDTIYIYFGNGSATNQQNKTGVWDTNFKGVWHFPNGTTLSGSDSTSNANNTTGTNSPTATTGQIDGGLGLVKASSQYMSTGSNSNSNTTGDLTVGLWAYNTVSNATDATPIANNVNNIYMYMNGGEYEWYDGTIIDSGTTIPQNVWTYLTVTRASNQIQFYKNGAPIGSTHSTTPPGASGNAIITIGSQSGIQLWDGKLDEARFATTARSADWVLTEYNNQSSPSSFYGYGQLQTITRQTSGGSSQPAVKSRGGVRFR